MFAHRGGSGLAPENTLVAFDRGVAAGADGIELDVHLARDRRVVVHHDRMLDRTTDLDGPIADRTSDELRRADAAWRFGPAAGYPFRGQGIGVPTLDEVLARHRDVRTIVELKVNSLALADAAVDAVRRADAIDRVCFGSFARRVLRAVRAAEPSIATSAARGEVRCALYRSRLRLPLGRVKYQGYQVPETSGPTRVVSPRFIDRAHAAGLGVQVWTVDEEADARRLLDWGVDALITDRPDIIVPVVRAANRDRRAPARKGP